MKESELYPPVRDWLRKQGYTVYVEIFDCDVIGVKDGRYVVVELKPCLTGELMTQMHQRSAWADEVWAAIASEPRVLSSLKYHGYGLLQVRDGKARKRVKAKQQPYFREKMRAYRSKRLAKHGPAQDHELAGLPSCPALKTQRRQREVSQTAGYFNLITKGEAE